MVGQARAMPVGWVLAAVLLCVRAHEGCLKSPLPSDLDMIENVERIEGREVNLVGEYRVGDNLPGEVLNTTTGFIEHTMTLNAVTQASILRVSLSQSEGVEMKISLLQDDWQLHGVVAASSERHIFANLTENHAYKLKFFYRLTKSDLHCPTVYMEFAMGHADVAAGKLRTDAKCFAATTFREGDFSLDMMKKLPKEDLTSDGQVKTLPAMEKLRMSYNFTGWVDESFSLRTEGKYFIPIRPDTSVAGESFTPIALPRLVGRRSEWLLKLKITADFLVGGSIGAVVTTDDYEYAAKKCFTKSGDRIPHLQDCIMESEDDRGKFVATGRRGQMKNTYVLQAILSSQTKTDAIHNLANNEYRLWVFAREEFFFLKNSCINYGVEVTLSPIDEVEDPLNCDSFPLPASLNSAPGIYDAKTRSVQLYGNVALDKTKGTQNTTFTPEVKSLLRASVEHPFAELTILLKESENGGNIKATAKADQYKPRGVVHTLEKGVSYTLYFAESTTVYTESWDEQNEFVPFCDSFLARVDIQPVEEESNGRTEQSASVPSIDFSVLKTAPKRLHFISIASSKAAGELDEASGRTPPKSIFDKYDKEKSEFAYSIPLNASDANQKWIQQTLYNETFDILEESVFKLTIDRNFLLGDVTAMLMYSRDSTTQTTKDDMWYSHNIGRVNTLDAVLRPGTYNLALATGFVQEPVAGESEMFGSSVAEFSFDLSIFPLNDSFSRGVENSNPTEFSSVYCEGLRALPKILPLYTHKVKHILEDFAIPYEVRSQFLLLSPQADSILHLRVMAKSHNISVSVWKYSGSGDPTELKEGIAIEDLYKGQLWLMAKLEAGVLYSVHFQFEETDQRCGHFTLQLSVAPSEFERPEGPCQTSLPPADLLADLKLPFTHSQTHAMDGAVVMPHTHINFEISEETGAVVLKVLAEYDFKFQHVYLDICKCKSSTYEECWECGVVRGDPIFNGEMIRASSLEPGFYTLKVYESKVTSVVPANCESFHLSVWMDKVNRDTKDALPGHNCTHIFLPNYLNIPGHLDALSHWETNEKFHLDYHTLGTIRVDHRRKLDYTSFTVPRSEPGAVFKAYIPPSYDIPALKVKLRLVRVTKGAALTDTGKYTWAVVATADEGTTLEALVHKDNSYRLEISYEEGEAVMPNDDGSFTDDKVGLECVSVPIEISLVDAQTYKSEGLGESCKATANIPAKLEHDSNMKLDNMLRPLPENFAHVTEFKLGPKGGRVEVDMRSTFETGSLHFHLMKKDEAVSQAEQWDHFYPQRYPDRDYLFVTLDEGDYEVHFHNTSAEGIASAEGKPPLAGCQKYALRMNLEDFAVSKPNETHHAGDCPMNKAFPEHLEKVDKSSYVIWRNKGYNFVKDDVVGQGTTPSDSFPLEVTDESVVRIWTHTHNVDVDLDIEIMDENGIVEADMHKNSHVESLFKYFPSGIEKPLSIVIRPKVDSLPSKPYAKGVDYDTCEGYKDLTTFDTAIAYMLKSELHKAVRASKCTDDELVTLVKDTLDKGSDNFPLNLEDQTVVIGETHAQLIQKFGYNEKTFRKTTAVNIEVSSGFEVDLVAEMRFEFILAAFRLELFNVTGFDDPPTSAPLKGGEAELDENEEKDFDASAYIHVPKLYPGKYQLRITNRDEKKFSLLESEGEYCILSLLSIQGTAEKLTGEGTGGTTAPMLTSVTPLSQDDMMPLEPLHLTLTFTEAADTDVAEAIGLKCTCRKDSKVCSEDYTLKMKNIKEADLGKTWHVEFAESDTQALRWDSECALHLEDGGFKTSDGKPFKVGVECGGKTSETLKETPCKYTVVAGACQEAAYCYPLGACPVRGSGTGCAMCKKVLPDGKAHYSRPDPEKGFCPLDGGTLAPIVTTRPEELGTPLPTPAPTPVPTPVPTPPPRTAEPRTPLPTKETEKPSDAPKPPPTKAPTPQPSLTPSHVKPPLTPGKDDTPSPPTPSKGSSGSATSTVLLVLLVLTVIAAGVYFGWSKGMFGADGYRNPYNNQDDLDDDDADDLFEEDTAEDTQDAHPLEAVTTAPRDDPVV